MDRPERSDTLANRARILETAERLFAERGVGNVNMADVAQAAGVGKGTLYRNFSNKGELCLSLMDTQLKEFQDRQLARMREMTARQTPFVEQLVAFLEQLVGFTERHMPLLCEVQQHSQTPDDEFPRPHFWQYMTVHGLLRKAVQAGELPSDLDTPYLAEALLAPLAADTFRLQRQVMGFSVQRISAGLTSLLRGMGAMAETSD
jgi:AcrR family transcriptional regulator